MIRDDQALGIRDDQGLGYIQGLGIRDQGLGFIQGLGIKDQGLGILGFLGFRVWTRVDIDRVEYGVTVIVVIVVDFIQQNGRVEQHYMYCIVNLYIDHFTPRVQGLGSPYLYVDMNGTHPDP